jgi:hypothetical protein
MDTALLITNGRAGPFYYFKEWLLNSNTSMGSINRMRDNPILKATIPSLTKRLEEGGNTGSSYVKLMPVTWEKGRLGGHSGAIDWYHDGLSDSFADYDVLNPDRWDEFQCDGLDLVSGMQSSLQQDSFDIRSWVSEAISFYVGAGASLRNAHDEGIVYPTVESTRHTSNDPLPLMLATLDPDWLMPAADAYAAIEDMVEHEDDSGDF